MSLAYVVGVSGGIQVRRVTVHTRPFVVDVLTVAGRREAAGFDDRRHVNGGGGVSSQDDAVFVDVLRHLDRSGLVIGQRGQPEVSWMD